MHYLVILLPHSRAWTTELEIDDFKNFLAKYRLAYLF